MSVPIENLNIAFIGEVSTGKSTLLNGIFCRELSQTSIKRTTMSPIVFIENKDLDCDYDYTKDIFEEIKEQNIDIIKSTEQGNALENCSELTYEIGKLDLKILEEQSVNVYDIPGLNDARTKSVYYNYLKSNFHKFNIVILMIDINSGLNTSDEIDILRLITENTKYQKETNKKEIYTIVVVNKADDMQIKVDKKTNKETLYLADELNEMFQQVILTVNEEFKKMDISNHLIDILPLCGLDAYLYRMISRYGKSYHLKDSEILKIGINEMGKKFSKKSKDEQRQDVISIIENKNFVNDMIKLSGFEGFEKSLYNFLQKDNMAQKLLISNINYEMNKLERYDNPFNQFNMDYGRIQKYINDRFEYICKILHLDETIFTESMLNLYNDTMIQLRNFINQYWEINDIKSYFTEIDNRIIENYFKNIKMYDDKYPPFIINRVMVILENKFTNNVIRVSNFIEIFEYLIEIKANSNENIEKLLNIIMENINHKNTFYYLTTATNQLATLCHLLDKLTTVDEKLMERFIRFLLMNYYEQISDNTEELLFKELFLKSHNEIIMSKYLSIKTSNSNEILLSSKVFLYGEEYRDIVAFDNDILESYYLEFMKKSKLNEIKKKLMSIKNDINK